MDRALELFERVFGDPGANLGAMGVALLFVVALGLAMPVWVPVYAMVRVARFALTLAKEK